MHADSAKTNGRSKRRNRCPSEEPKTELARSTVSRRSVTQDAGEQLPKGGTTNGPLPVLTSQLELFSSKSCVALLGHVLQATAQTATAR